MYQDFLLVYYGSDGGGGRQRLDRPLRTTLDRFALVTWVNREPMSRMLQPSELTRTMGFMEDYSLTPVRTRQERIKVLGNGVAPPVMEAIVRRLTSGPPSSHGADAPVMQPKVTELAAPESARSRVVMRAPGLVETIIGGRASNDVIRPAFITSLRNP
jgi:hypothetical protein